MTNVEIVDAFVEVLLEAPDFTIQAVQLRLAHTDYEVVLKKADPLKHFDLEKSHLDLLMFPFAVGQEGGGG